MRISKILSSIKRQVKPSVNMTTALKVIPTGVLLLAISPKAIDVKSLVSDGTTLNRLSHVAESSNIADVLPEPVEVKVKNVQEEFGDYLALHMKKPRR